MNIELIIQIVYLISAILFVVGLKFLNSPDTARKGNALAALGMFSAIVITLLDQQILDYSTIIVGIIIGTLIGSILALKIKMTAMPQLVAVFNGFGGGASALIASAAILGSLDGIPLNLTESFAGIFAVLIGFVTLIGSVVAFGKLQELLNFKSFILHIAKYLTIIVFIVLLVFCGMFIFYEGTLPMISLIFWVIVMLSLLLGLLLVIPIGGADMPVVISLMNSYSGIAACAAGFAINNNILIIAGALVGAAGFILTQIMIKAMNRSIFNVMFGAFGSTTDITSNSSNEGSIREVNAEDAAIVLGYARSVIVVPGYGLAVSQAQHNIRELATLLQERGVQVKYAIHPVAGRMPGHMNVLLAEANVPYEQLYDIDQINSEFENTDIAVIIGANDVVNPAAKNTPGSPIYGMPILNVDNAKNILVLKRGLNPGFAGIENEIFFNSKTMMLFGDAKKSIMNLVEKVQDL
mgnify:CR=1 FL=1